MNGTRPHVARLSRRRRRAVFENRIALRYQTEAMFVLDAIVDKKHPYRAMDRVVDFHALAKPLHARYSDKSHREIGAEPACAC